MVPLRNTNLHRRKVSAEKEILNSSRVIAVVGLSAKPERPSRRIAGLVLNWSAVPLAGLHVDPLAIKAKVAIDATRHGSEICHIVVKKIDPKLRTKTGEVIGEKPMWAEVGEREIIENTKEAYPGLIVAGMAANAVFGSPRMGAIFGGMLLSGKRAAEVALDILSKK
ncbi:MAG: thiazole biosynthesis enzyme [Chloroflexi bacterium CG23_combo_of_CG06-09_8_20_14_all_45_10]|nr:MAG: thiazole biosynthesis enzyme [Chloroflexi bacterium CG23_combo_of_CG06-09_8_20_14_all_45_10]